MQKSVIIMFIVFSIVALHAQPILPIVKKQSTTDSLKNIPLRVLAANYYASNLPFFCRQELQIHKLIKVPFKFRIGSVEAVDKLEGKHSGKP